VVTLTVTDVIGCEPITSQLNRQMTNDIVSSLTNQDNDQRLLTSTDDPQFT